MSDETQSDPAAALRTRLQQERDQLWAQILASDQWQQLQRLDGAIAALTTVLETSEQEQKGE